MEPAGAGKTTKKVCVTGAGGFIASWLVRQLLSGGDYAVHGTVRDPGMTPASIIRDSEYNTVCYNTTVLRMCVFAGDTKNAHLTALDGAGERLRLFKADVLDYASVTAAVAGCDGVFHVASPVLAGKSSNPEVTPQDRAMPISPTGTLVRER